MRRDIFVLSVFKVKSVLVYYAVVWFSPYRPGKTKHPIIRPLKCGRTDSHWKGLTAAERAERELAENIVAEGETSFFPLSLCIILD